LAEVGKGRLILVSADLEGDFEKRPAAYSLKNALFRYALSVKWNENTNRITYDQIEQSLFPVLRMEQLTDKVLCEGAGVHMENIHIENDGMELVCANPNSSFEATTKTLPINITIVFKKKIDIKGILYMPEQRERKGTAIQRSVK
jgi:hypothetical protein